MLAPPAGDQRGTEIGRKFFVGVVFSPSEHEHQPNVDVALGPRLVPPPAVVENTALQSSYLGGVV